MAQNGAERVLKWMRNGGGKFQKTKKKACYNRQALNKHEDIKRESIKPVLFNKYYVLSIY